MNAITVLYLSTMTLSIFQLKLYAVVAVVVNLENKKLYKKLSEKNHSLQF